MCRCPSVWGSAVVDGRWSYSDAWTPEPELLLTANCTAQNTDLWGFYDAECVSFIAWRMNNEGSRLGSRFGSRFGPPANSRPDFAVN
ncbi:hypothetical protein GCM10009839_33050 [Catenulispora yoronensis]|uniref:C-type lectin domain-containing protein n=1 Tax=Catenulispora yoronensis TaxID=450799 RepID=A0ABP5FNJ3_9ACTN